jgi:ribonuclease T2
LAKFMILRFALRRAAGVAALFSLPLAASSQTAPPVATAPFDYYVMTLSWSPGFCDLGGEEKSPRQCAAGDGDGLVVHGLWPNNRYGPNPEECELNAYASSADLAETRGLYPADGLAAYEYRKHGSCTGLSAHDYYAAVRSVREQLNIPEVLHAPRQRLLVSPAELQQAFISANANLRPDNMAITCRRGELVDVRFCLSRDLKAFAVCPKVSGHTCHSASIAVAPVR